MSNGSYVEALGIVGLEKVVPFLRQASTVLSKNQADEIKEIVEHRINAKLTNVGFLKSVAKQPMLGALSRNSNEDYLNMNNTGNHLLLNQRSSLSKKVNDLSVDLSELRSDQSNVSKIIVAIISVKVFLNNQNLLKARVNFQMNSSK